jgi:hypothetical protein
VSTVLKSTFAATESVQGPDKQYVIPGLKKVIRKIIKGYTSRNERIKGRLASLNEVFGLVFPGMQVQVVPTPVGLPEDCHNHAITVTKENGPQSYPVHSLSDGEKEGTHANERRLECDWLSL